VDDVAEDWLTARQNGEGCKKSIIKHTHC